MAVVDVKALEALAAPVASGLGYELIELEWKPEGGRWVLRAYIDRAGQAEGAGISLDDCTRMSHALSAELDVADAIHIPYTLEVSSPGLDRPLRRETDFRRFAGKQAKIRTRHPIGPAEENAAPRRNFKGELLGVEDGRIRIAVEGRVYEIPVADVEKANLQYEG